MSYTFLQAVNRGLKRVKAIEGDAGDLTTFTDSARQHEIDVLIQVWNEALHALYGLGAFQGELKVGTINLVTDQKEYDVPTDFETMAGKTRRDRVMISATKGARLVEYPGGYERMYRDQTEPSDLTGYPTRWVINKTNNKFSFDNTPTSTDDGETLTFLYEKRISLTVVGDTFPVSDTVVDALLPVVAEIYRIDIQGRGRNPINAFSGFKNAVRLVTQTKPRSFYGTERVTRHAQNPRIHHHL
ncbi:hypothetical protein LCGC14_1740990 [marine sediment metagenome]|uniref:Uncharacterized protein n=1 Tax=marine sediment metagenome TaxID=412755 RepID=A0A0F9JLV6_9ZZZZ